MTLETNPCAYWDFIIAKFSKNGIVNEYKYKTLSDIPPFQCSDII